MRTLLHVFRTTLTTLLLSAMFASVALAQSLAFSEVVLENDYREITIFTNNTSINLNDYVVYYTLNGSRPTRNNGQVYNGPFVVDRTSRIMAVIYNETSPLTGLIHSYNVAMNSVMFAYGTQSLDLPVPIDQSLRNVRAVAPGDGYTIVAAGPWDVRMYGNSMSASAAFESLSPENPDPVNTPSTIALAAGGGFGLALRSNGTVVGWGDNSFGQTNTSSLSQVIAIAAGTSHGVALHANGTVSSWGFNLFDVTRVPDDLANVIAIDAGEFFSVALLDDGTVRVWGNDEFGVLNIPAGLNNVVEISAANDYVVARKSDGTLVAWGMNLGGRTNIPGNLPPMREIAAGSATRILGESGGVFTAGNGTLTPFQQSEGVMRVFSSDTHVITMLRESFYVEPVVDFTLELTIYNFSGEGFDDPILQTLTLGTTSNVLEIASLNQFAPPPPPDGGFVAYLFAENTYFFRYFQPTTITENRWDVTILSSHLNVIGWDPSDLETAPGSFLMRYVSPTGTVYTANMRTNIAMTLPATASVEIIHFYEDDIEVTYPSGFQLISNPLLQNIENPAEVFQPAHANSLFAYNQVYTEATQLNQTNGYWLKFTGPSSVTFSPPFRDFQVLNDLESGWHLIASPGYNFPVTHIEDPSNILVDGRVYGYELGYNEVSVMEPGRGYWIHVDSDHALSNMLFFDSSPDIGNQNKRQFTEPAGFARLELLNDGQARTFFLDGDLQLSPEIHPRSFEQPPMPPAEAFDARFTNNALLSEQNRATIRVQSPGAWLELKNTSEDARRLLIDIRRNGSNESETYSLDPGEEIRVAGSGVRDIQVESVKLTSVGPIASDLPAEVGLEPNYPNPFNPETNIRFALPAAQQVSLRVYTMLGQEVAVLVNEVRAAGQHSIRFEAGQLASGVYLYRLETGGTVLIRSMTLVK